MTDIKAAVSLIARMEGCVFLHSRPRIIEIFANGEDSTCFRVGRNAVDAIIWSSRNYGDRAEAAYYVFSDDKLMASVNARYVETVIYDHQGDA